MLNWGMMTKAERDAAYNNTDAVKNSAQLNEQRIAASAAFRAAHPGHLDLRYGPKERNVWDLFPAKDPEAPCLVFIHGGYWQRNSRDQFASLVAGVHAHGWAGALPGYTLAVYPYSHSTSVHLRGPSGDIGIEHGDGRTLTDALEKLRSRLGL